MLGGASIRDGDPGPLTFIWGKKRKICLKCTVGSPFKYSSFVSFGLMIFFVRWTCFRYGTFQYYGTSSFFSGSTQIDELLHYGVRIMSTYRTQSLHILSLPLILILVWFQKKSAFCFCLSMTAVLGGSGMFSHPRSTSANWSILTPKIVSKLSEIWSGLFIPDLRILIVYPSRIRGGQKGTGSWIRIRQTGMRGVSLMLQNSTASRVMYGFLLLVTVVISCIMLAPGVQVSQLFIVFFILWNYGRNLNKSFDARIQSFSYDLPVA